MRLHFILLMSIEINLGIYLFINFVYFSRFLGNQNLVVSECKVHNDATISISNDNTKVAVLLSSNQYDQPDWLGM